MTDSDSEDADCCSEEVEIVCESFDGLDDRVDEDIDVNSVPVSVSDVPDEMGDSELADSDELDDSRVLALGKAVEFVQMSVVLEISIPEVGPVDSVPLDCDADTPDGVVLTGTVGIDSDTEPIVPVMLVTLPVLCELSEVSDRPVVTCETFDAVEGRVDERPDELLVTIVDVAGKDGMSVVEGFRGDVVPVKGGTESEDPVVIVRDQDRVVFAVVILIPGVDDTDRLPVPESEAVTFVNIEADVGVIVDTSTPDEDGPDAVVKLAEDDGTCERDEVIVALPVKDNEA